MSSEPNVAFVGFDNVTTTVSSTSSNASFTILAIVIVPVVLPAEIVSDPLARVKSVPLPVAVPVIA